MSSVQGEWLSLWYISQTHVDGYPGKLLLLPRVFKQLILTPGVSFRVGWISLYAPSAPWLDWLQREFGQPALKPAHRYIGVGTFHWCETEVITTHSCTMFPYIQQPGKIELTETGLNWSDISIE